MIAMAAVFAMAVTGAFVIVDQTDAVYSEDYGPVYTINLAPGYTYRYTPTYPTGLEVKAEVLKYESEGIVAQVTSGTLAVTVVDGITSGQYDVVLKASSTTGGVSQTAYQHIRINVVSGLKVNEAANYINDIIKGATVTFRAQASTNATNPSGETFPITWSVTKDHELPAGLELTGNATDGFVVSGIPTETGRNTVYLTASSAGQTADIVVPFNVWQVIVQQQDETIYSHGNSVSSHIIPQSVSDTDTSGDLILSWEVTSGNMPDGFLLDEETGKITGSSTAFGSTVLTIVGTHAASEQSVTKKVTICTESVISISSDRTKVPIYDGMEDQTVGFSVTTESSKVTWSVPETMGVDIDPDTGVLTVSSGASAGTVTVTATTAYGQTAESTVQVVSEIRMTVAGPSTVSTSAETSVEKTYTCNVSDVTWSVRGEYIGVDINIDPITGVLTLHDNNPSETDIAIVATSNVTGQEAEFPVHCTVVAKLVFSAFPTGGVIAYAV